MLPKGRFGLTLVYQMLRACERFGLDPTRWDEMDGAWKRQLLDYEIVREAEEARADGGE